MSNPNAESLQKYMNQELDLKLNGNRHVTGILRGFDQFMNIVLADAKEKNQTNQKGTTMIIRGNSIIMMECKH